MKVISPSYAKPPMEHRLRPTFNLGSIRVMRGLNLTCRAFRACAIYPYLLEYTPAAYLPAFVGHRDPRGHSQRPLAGALCPAYRSNGDSHGFFCVCWNNSSSFVLYLVFITKVNPEKQVFVVVIARSTPYPDCHFVAIRLLSYSQHTLRYKAGPIAWMTIGERGLTRGVTDNERYYERKNSLSCG